MRSFHPTQELCERIADVRFESLNAQTVFKAQEAIRDGLTVGAAGCQQRPVMILAEYVRSQRSGTAATVWGHRYRTSLAGAALVNAASIHVLDYEPMSNPSAHVVSPVLGCVMAIAEAHGRSGRDIVTACVKGFEMQHRLLGAAIGAARRERELRQFHIAGVVGVMGSAVAAAHLLELDAIQLSNALGIAASRAGSLTANAGTMTKCTHAGNAASAGLEAALLAQHGFDANRNILEEDLGYVAAFFSGGAFNYEELLDFGNPFRIVDPGMAFKFYPAKYPTQFTIGAALELHAQIGDPARIARVTITAPIMHDVDRPQPSSGLEGKFSFQYTAAAALLDGKVRIDSFSDAYRFRPEMTELLSKIKLIQRKEIPADLSKMRVAIAVDTTDGNSYAAECRVPKGYWGITISREAHMEKLLDCMQQLLSPAQIDEYVALTDRLDELDTTDVARLNQLMSGASAAQKIDIRAAAV